jgi:hypothetical protein
VERSFDGYEFKSIGRVDGFGEGISTTALKYKLPDPDKCSELRYYRLKQVDIDGNFSYSEVVAVNCMQEKSALNVYPNPSRGLIYCSFYELKDGPVKLQWIDVVGKIIKEETVDAIKGFNTVSSDVSHIAKGIYYLRLNSMNSDEEEVTRQVKFLKE